MVSYTEKYRFLFIAGTLLIVLCAYFPGGLFFLNDDLIHVPLSADAVFGQRRSIRPIHDVRLYIDSLLYHKNAVGYHLTNLLIHIINCVLVFFASKKILAIFKVERPQNIAFISALLFALYPFHSESVFWIIGATGSISLLFSLLSFLLLTTNSWLLYLLSLATFSLGLLTYESSWLFPILLCVPLVLYQKKWLTKNYIIKLVGVYIVFAAYMVLRFKITNEVAGNYGVAKDAGINIMQLVGNCVRLFCRSFAPPANSVHNFVTGFVAVSFIIAYLAFDVRKKIAAKYQLYIFLTIAFLLSFLPYLTLGIDTHGVESERYLYMPSVFFCLLLACLINELKPKLASVVLAASFIYFTTFLFISSNSFRKASYLCQSFYSIVKDNQPKRNLFVENVPKEYNGAVILRLGLEEGAKWLLPTNAYQNLYIISYNPDEDYETKGKPAITNVVAKDSIQFKTIVQRDSLTNSVYETKQMNGLFFVPGKDVLIKYTDAAILVYK